MADNRTPKKDWKGPFLIALAASGNVRLSAQAAGVRRQRVYEAKAVDAEFSNAWDDAIEDATDDLEQEARRRAIEGTNKPVFYQGSQCGTIREYSDTLLIFLLKANRPEKFRDNYDIKKMLDDFASARPANGQSGAGDPPRD